MIATIHNRPATFNSSAQNYSFFVPVELGGGGGGGGGETGAVYHSSASLGYPYNIIYRLAIATMNIWLIVAGNYDNCKLLTSIIILLLVRFTLDMHKIIHQG